VDPSAGDGHCVLKRGHQERRACSGAQLINTSQAQILFALKTAGNVTGEGSGKLFTGTGMATCCACYPERFFVVFRRLKVNYGITVDYVTVSTFHGLPPHHHTYGMRCNKRN